MTELPFGLMLKLQVATAVVAHVAHGQMDVAQRDFSANAMGALKRSVNLFHANQCRQQDWDKLLKLSWTAARAMLMKI